MSAVDWRSLFVQACIAFEQERVRIWLDREFGVEVPELDALRAARSEVAR